MIKKLLVALLWMISSSATAAHFGSESVLVVEDGTGKILFEKNATPVMSIASLTKLMTAMVVLDANLNMHELITIDRSDVDILKHSMSRVPVGAKITRGDLLQLALMSSDNRAAVALARTFPGGHSGFVAAARAKAAMLGMSNTSIVEASGLSPGNVSTAYDLVKMAQAASRYPDITRMTTDKTSVIHMSSRAVNFKNTNRLIGTQGWDIRLSKTGYTEEAGRCFIMRIAVGSKLATLVLLNAHASSVRIQDASNIRRAMGGELIQTVKKKRKSKRRK